jgi:hypothetical protein
MKTTGRLLFALLVGTTAVVVSCGDPSPVGLGSRRPALQANVLDSLLGTVLEHARGLVHCTPLPYDSVTKTIGPEGDTIQVGLHTLRVPPGALGQPVSITAVAPTDSLNRVDFQPEGLVFQQPASLVMSYANCDLSQPRETPEAVPPGAQSPSPQALAATAKRNGANAHGRQLDSATVQQDSANVHGKGLRIAYITDSLEIIEYLESADDSVSKKVTGRLGHFSDYALAW